MDTILAGYAIDEKIYESFTCVVYRAYHQDTQRQVILKILKANYPSLLEVARYQHEYDFLRSIDLPGVVQAYSLEKLRNSPVLVLEDFGGRSLAHWLSAHLFTLAEFLQLATSITDVLGQLHQQGIIHKDINPNNIVWNPKTNQLKLIDFGFASRLARETPIPFSHSTILEGSLPYISPEQTGRMNRSVDYRTDFYSLGVSLYELITGQLPFISSDSMELVHAHITKIPLAPDVINKAVPSIIAEIVMKLMAKTAEQRYQSAEGLQVDLQECLRRLEKAGHIEAFPLGQFDASDLIQIPEKLYGRDEEIAQLLSVFDRVASGATSIVICTGEAGIGKSMLVNELHKAIVEKRGYFVSGKYDQFKRDIPYSGITKALQEFTRQILMESEENLNYWKDEILRTVGNNGKVIIDVIPELERIIGAQPDVQSLTAVEAQNRFQYVFQNFVRTISSHQRPLVLFLDDLQWADSASFNLLKRLTTDAENRFFLLVGAYRDSEVSSSHPLMLALEAIKQAKIVVSTITIAPLSFNDVNELLAGTLRSALAYTQSLSAVVYEKTQGNPFFVKQFLKSLHEEKFLTFDFEQRIWQWDTEMIRNQNVTDNVVSLMVGKIHKLPAMTQDVLRLASCIGNGFDLATLAAIHEHKLIETLNQLWSAIIEGLILPLDDNYKLIARAEHTTQANFKFLHDRVQQAAYSLIPNSEKQIIHLHIGRLLLVNTSAEVLNERLFEIVNHLNQGLELIGDQLKRTELASLNLRAGQKAKDSTAYEAALRYLSTGIALLPADSWETAYQLSSELYIQQAECEYLTGNFYRAGAFFELALSRAKSPLDQARILSLWVILSNGQANLGEALNYGKKGLALLGNDLPDDLDSKRTELGKQLALLNSQLEETTIEDLINLPELSAPEKIKIMELCLNMLPSAHQTGDLDLYALLALKMVNQSILLGNCSFSSHAYIIYAVILVTAFGDYTNAYRFGKLGLDLSKKYNTASIDAKNYFALGTFITFWNEPLKSSLENLLAAYLKGLESGDLIYAAYSVCNLLTLELSLGRNLEEVYQGALKYILIIESIKDQVALSCLKLYMQFVLNLKGKTRENDSLDDDQFDETAWIHTVREANNLNLIARHLVCKLELSYFYGNYAEAVKIGQDSIILQQNRGSFLEPEFLFYQSLSLAALYPTLPREEQAPLIQTLAGNQQQFTVWAENCPENYQHMNLLLGAEIAKFDGRDLDAMAFYDQAAQSAHAGDFIHHEALVNELAAKFYSARKQEKIASLYMTEAHYLYRLWGARRKVKDLERQYPHWLTAASTENENSPQIPSTHQPADIQLDLATILKASQAISSEIDFDKLLSQLIRIAVENAGAETGILILETEGKLLVEAFATVTMQDLVIRQSVPVEAATNLSLGIVNYVARTHEAVILTDAAALGLFTADPYVQSHRPKSVMCVPILHIGNLTGLLYFENNLITGAFTSRRLEVLTMLASQTAISIENSRLYADLQAQGKKLQEANLSLQHEMAERQKAEESYHSIFENAIEGIFRSTSSGKIVSANPGLARMLGYSSPQELMRAVTDIGTQFFTQSKDRSEFARKLADHGTVQRFETEANRKDGTVIWISINAHSVSDRDGQIIYFEGIALDITERKRAEEALRQSERRFSSIFHISPIAITISQINDRRYIDVNDSYLSLHGYSREEVLNGAVRTSTIWAEPQERANYEYLQAEHGAVRQFEFKFLKKSGEIGTGLLSSERFELDGEAYSIAFTLDITERQEAEQQRLELALANEKVQALSEFLANMSHNLKTPLAVIKICLYLLDKVKDPVKQQDQFRTIKDQTQTLEKYIQDILLISRLDYTPRLSMKQIDFNNLIRKVAEELRPSAEKNNLRTKLNLDDDMPPILGDEDELYSAIVNLVENAFNYTPEGGSVTIDTFARNHQVVARVSDSGIGITEADLPHIFERFYRANEAKASLKTGSGLGLAIVKRVIDLHQGTINVESKLGKGTTFELRLPAGR